MRRRRLEGDIAVDTSILVEVALGTRSGKDLARLMIDGAIIPYTTSLNVTELLYVLCRLLGMEEAERRVRLLLDSGYLIIVSSDRVSRTAADCKCRFPLSIVDCHILALAKDYGLPVVFYRKERELERVLEGMKKWLGIELFFLTELARP